jgi:glycosyltransferase involved in cell wall biosynthesis
MKVLFINTTDIAGGAAIVAQRLMKGLHARYSTENRLLVKIKDGKDPGTEKILSNPVKIISEKIIDRVSRKLGLLYQSFPFSSQQILSQARSFKPDIISLHNTHGAYFSVPLIEHLSKIAPIVWTLHDMWSFTGNASHTFGNMSWKFLKNDKELSRIPPAIGINTGAYLLRQKKRVYQHSDLSIITPSLWLKDLAEQSPVFEGKKIYQVYNGIDPEIFYPRNKRQAKKELGLPEDKPTIMFSSHFLDKDNPWKGGYDLLEILSRIDAITKNEINFLVLGEGKLNELKAFPKFNIFMQGYIHDEIKMSKCLSATDLFIYPTRADNLPNVLVESIACGTPCITFDIGGNKEIIKHNFNGIIINPFDFDSFARNTVDLLENTEQLLLFQENCRPIVKEQFGLNKMTDSYYSIFTDILSNK